MGWIRLGRNQKAEVGLSMHVEDVEAMPSLPVPIPHSLKRRYPFVANDVTDEALPFIPKHEVLARRRITPETDVDSISDHPIANRELWIVVDSIVYDCSDFIFEHPGGMQVILSFVGEDCSWQFWRFHSQNEMNQYARALRIGRTIGIRNKFTELPRYVGLKKLGDDWFGT